MHAWGAGERGKSDQWQRIQEHYANRNDGTSGSGLRRRRRRRGNGQRTTLSAAGVEFY